MTAPDPSADHQEPETADELRADIAATRAELADTVRQLSAKLDVKSRAKQELQKVRSSKAVPLAAAAAAAALAVVLILRRRRKP
jgi:hypothetical protein